MIYLRISTHLGFCMLVVVELADEKADAKEAEEGEGVCPFFSSSSVYWPIVVGRELN